MAEKWYYMEGAERKGPLNRRQMQTIVVTGLVQEKTWVWRQGMSDWSPAERVDEFRPALEESRIARSRVAPQVRPPGPSPTPALARPGPGPAYPPPAHPGALPSAAARDRTPKPWRRFWARQIDNIVEALPFCLIMFLLLGMLGFDASSEVDLFVRFLTAFLLSSLSVYVLSSLILSWFGTSFGKWMFGLWVVRRGGGALTLPQALGRNLGVFFIGQSAGVFAPLAYLWSFQRLVQNGRTYYDEIGGFDVVSERGNWGRFAAGMLLVVLCFALTLMLAFIGIIPAITRMSENLF